MLARVEQHAVNHGAYSETALKCKFCDYYCESRESMAQHIKVHSLQYQVRITIYLLLVNVLTCTMQLCHYSVIFIFALMNSVLCVSR